MLSDLTLHVTGLPSPGKARLIEELRRQPFHADVEVYLHVHAETDIEAMLESSALARVRDEARAADLVVAVDWEPVEKSVTRVLDALSRKLV